MPLHDARRHLLYPDANAHTNVRVALQPLTYVFSTPTSVSLPFLDTHVCIPDRFSSCDPYYLFSPGPSPLRTTLPSLRSEFSCTIQFLYLSAWPWVVFCT